MTDDKLKLLLQKRITQTLSPEEKRELESLLVSRWFLEEENHERDWEHIYKSRIQPNKKIKRINYTWLSAAVVLIVLGISMTLYILRDNNLPGVENQIAITPYVIKGAKDGAILSVNSGKQFELDKKQLSEVIRNLESDTESPQTQLFTITTPKANKYTFTLPDGTKVWMNANSEVTFPEHFSADERMIQTKGEVFLEVTKSKIPFIVKTNQIETRVLGTSFNINAYHPDKIQTTLFTGKIALRNNINVLELTPGQAVMASENSLTRMTPNLEKVISWKNNKFYFENESIEEILAELERWYDVKFDFDPQERHAKRYSGVIGRDLTLQQTLEILNFSTSLKLTISNHKTIQVQ